MRAAQCNRGKQQAAMEEGVKAGEKVVSRATTYMTVSYGSLLESYSGLCVGASVGFWRGREEEDWRACCGAAGRATMTLFGRITFSRGHKRHCLSMAGSLC
jgi:hypothetical protein